MNDSQTPVYDPASFSTKSYAKKFEKPWGYEIHWVSPAMPYMGKLIHINQGKRLSLQVHDTKQESFFLISGEAVVIWEDSTGSLIETSLEPGAGYTVDIGQKHRLVGITDCEVIEVSTPETGTTWRLEEDFSRPNETPDQRKKERGE
jgi:mannose-6-phosphate isomerase-like protein (cupin superfamily)